MPEKTFSLLFKKMLNNFKFTEHFFSLNYLREGSDMTPLYLKRSGVNSYKQGHLPIKPQYNHQYQEINTN